MTQVAAFPDGPFGARWVMSVPARLLGVEFGIGGGAGAKS